MKIKSEQILRSFINKILSEGLTDILYHFTHVGYLLNILETNEFNLTAAIGSKADLDVNKKRFFFLSTTRSKSTGYKRGNAKIVLDGAKLNKRYKGYPMDYWQYSKNPEDWPDKQSYLSALKSGEQEDRIVSNKSTIPNAISYILAIHIFYKDPNNYSLRKILEICQSNNIPVYFYSNESDWLNENKKNALKDLSPILNAEPKEEYLLSNHKRFDYDIASLIAFNDSENHQKIVDYLADPEKIEKFEKTLRQRTFDNFNPNATYQDDGLRYISAAIHNSRSKTDKDSKYILELLAADMRKLKTGTLKDYLEKKQFKGKKTLSDLKKDLYQYLTGVVQMEFDQYFNDYFGFWIEIQGEYYNYAYESPEVKNLMIKYIQKIDQYLKTVIFSKEQDIFNYFFPLSYEEMSKALGSKNVDAKNLIKITDNQNDVDYFNEKFNEFLNNYLIREIDRKYYEKIQELKSLYKQQFNY